MLRSSWCNEYTFIGHRLVADLFWDVMTTGIGHRRRLETIVKRLRELLMLQKLLLLLYHSSTLNRLPLIMVVILLRYIVLLWLINRRLNILRVLLLLLVRIRHLRLQNVSKIQLHNLFHLLIMKVDVLPKMIWIVVEDV